MLGFAIGLICGVIITASLHMGASYRNGFSDGVHWMWEGESFPSKPDWAGWDAMRRKRCIIYKWVSDE